MPRMTDSSFQIECFYEKTVCALVDKNKMAMESDERRFKGSGVSKDVSTFLSWGKENIIGYKTKKVADKELVIEIWCKICAKHKVQLLTSVKGAAVQFLKAFTSGTNNVTKHQVSPLVYCFP